MDKAILTTQPKTGKMDHFYGDRSIVLSKKQNNMVKNNSRVGDLYFNRMGFYPNAKHHFRKRNAGSEEHILIYCVNGKGYIQLHGADHELAPNSFFVIHANQAHSYWASPEDPWSIYWLHFSGPKSAFFSDFFGRTHVIPQTSSSRTDDRIRLFNEMLTVLELGLTNENLEFANLRLNGLLASFFYTETFQADKGIRSSDPVEKVIFFMQKNTAKLLSVAEMAEEARLSTSHLSRIFKNKTGASPMDYFIGLKMQEAIRLLSNKSMRVNEVAFTLGYTDPFYFSRIFKKQIGSTPTSFLKNSPHLNNVEQDKP